jgi:hypothetical protein
MVVKRNTRLEENISKAGEEIINERIERFGISKHALRV